jgi:hypothetical protein
MKADEFRRNLVILCGAVVIIVAALAAEVDSDGSVFVCGMPTLKLPVLCPCRRCLGVCCPACGLTRSLIHLLHGRPGESWSAHRFGGLVLAAIMLQLPYRAWRISRRSGPSHPSRAAEVALLLFTGALIVNWLVP